MKYRITFEMVDGHRISYMKVIPISLEMDFLNLLKATLELEEDVS